MDEMDKIFAKNKTIPFSEEELRTIAKEHGTPFYIYDEGRIIQTARDFNQAFSWVENGGYQNFFAVKACPNPTILDILRQEGMGADCSSMPELDMADRVGLTGENIMFTANDVPDEEFIRASDLGAVINLDDITHIEALEKSAGIPELICFRYNPGPLRVGNDIIGNPVDAKYGVTKDQIVDAYKTMKKKGSKRFGLHTMIVSNMRDEKYLVETADMLFKLVADISRDAGIDFEFVNLGGGVGIPYKLDDKTVDLKVFSKGVKEAYEDMIRAQGLPPLRVVTECGRAITGPHGYLVSSVRHTSKKYKDYVGLDSCMANLMRPGMYDAYHHITVVGKEESPHDKKVDVTGSLCENCDKFAVDRPLPNIEKGDLLVIHEAGAHGYAMGFNYNAKLKCAELLMKPDRSVQKIRRAETEQDYFATLDGFWPRR